MDPPYHEVTYLPPAPGTYEPTSEDDCTSGKPQCVDKVIREMYRRFNPQAASCDHAAIFALTYLRTTEEYQRASLTPGFFEDPNFVNHEDAVFARFYFDAFDDWAADRRSEVPEAWRIALDAGKQKRVSTVGNLLLGVNAHINRDLPYVLAGIGLVKPDGTSRKPDHDKVPAARAAAEASIQSSAANTAEAIVAATAYGPLSGGSAARDAYCAVHHDD